ncbi:MAG: hypothetical protein QXU41_06925 [Candidatus Nitrosocaldus sp.]
MKESKRIIELDGSIRLGLSIPLFIAAILSLATGTLVGLLGIWGASAWGKPVPEWEKLGHAHTAWWSILIMVAAMLMPYASLKPTAKRLITIGTFIGPVLWIGMIASYYEVGGPRIWLFTGEDSVHTYYELPILGVGASMLEVLGFASLLLVGLSASGLKIPYLYSKPEQSRFDLISEVYVQRKIFLIPTLTISAGVLVGFALAGIFKVTHIPIEPAALVQLHTHPAMISTSAMLILLAMSIFNVSSRVFRFAYILMLISLPAILVGLILFNLLALHSLVWVVPAGIYYALLLISIPAIFKTGRSKGNDNNEEEAKHGAILGESSSLLLQHISLIPTIRLAVVICLSVLAILVGTGAYIALAYDTTPYTTVTYKQPEGSPYPGPYPDEYIGTAPVKGTPRGLENAHLSPGSWFHVAIAWLIILALFGNRLFENRVGLLTLLIFTIPMAPLFNTLGRYLAWLGIPNGIGALWFAGHPLKGFNIVVLFIIGLISLYVLSKKRSTHR